MTNENQVSSEENCVMQVILRVALNGNDRDEASAALSVLSSFFDCNADAQQQILSAIYPFEDHPSSNGIFISEILKAIDTCREGSEMGRRAVQVDGIAEARHVTRLLFLTGVSMLDLWQSNGEARSGLSSCGAAA